MNQDRILKINKRSFITVCIILLSFMIISYICTFLIPKGVYNEELNYSSISGKGLPFWKFIFSPFLVIFSDGGLSIIVISLFILILGGAFNVIDKTNGINSIIGALINKFKNHKYFLVYIIILVFMLFGSLFGIFEEAITLLPIIVLLSLALGFDTFTGIAMCLLAVGFGFSTAITNPFSVGLGSTTMGINLTDGIFYRIFVFVIMYLVLCIFTTIHIKRITKDPQKSPTYELDIKKKNSIVENELFSKINYKVLKVYVVFFIMLLLVIILSSVLKPLQGYSIPLIAIAFLFGSFICGLLLKHPFINIGKIFLSGLLGMAPAIIMLMLAGSIKYILDEGQIMATIIHNLTEMLEGTSPIVGILFVYLIILIIQFFIGSASAKIILIIPIISILADKLGISRQITLLAFIFGDGFTDLIYPTNPILLISLGMTSFSYIKWFKKTIILQLLVLLITVILLIIGYYMGY